MKKILFTLACVLTLVLSSCLDDTGSNYTFTYSRVVTIDTTSSPISLVADCTGEVFKNIENLKYTEHLSQFGLSNASRAEVYIQQDIDASYNQTLTLLQAEKINVQAVTNKEITDESLPFLAWLQKPLGDIYNPIVWVSGYYLNVVPIIPSSRSGKYYLTADHVAGDTLFFNLTASYNEESSKQMIDYLQCYDLRTLCDTANADPTQRAKIEEVLAGIEQHYRDSMRIVLMGDFIEYNYNYQGKDTIRTAGQITNYFRCNFLK